MGANPTAGIDFSSKEIFIYTILMRIKENKFASGGIFNHEEITTITNTLEFIWQQGFETDGDWIKVPDSKFQILSENKKTYQDD